MEIPENIEQQEDHESAWDRLKALREKRIHFNDTGKATLITMAGVPSVLEGVLHMPGNLGIGLTIGATILSLAHGDKAFRVGRWLKGRILEDNEIFQRPEERLEEKSVNEPSLNTKENRPDTAPTLRKKDDGKGILLGLEKKRMQEVRRNLKDLQSALLLGLPGQGKSTTACNIVSQLVEDYGAKIIIVDRHARSDESLTAMLSPWQSAFLMPPAREYTDMVDAFEMADQILEERINTDESPFPVLLVVDEMTSLLQKEGYSGEKGSAAKKCSEVVENWNEEGRKYLCFTLCIGQLTNASRTGGTEVRQLFSSFFVHGMSESQARMILGKEYAGMVNNLARGECVLLNTNSKEDPFVIRVPGLKKKPVPIERDPMKEFAAMENVDEDDGDIYESKNAPVNQQRNIVKVGIDVTTKKDVTITREQWNMLISMRANDMLKGFRQIMKILPNLTEAHARNLSGMLRDALGEANDED
ncbi:MAG: hypothetical protein AUG51_22070 [Acidobacteria bacterium 13_1_20CM_3_53_8]|nr:MAG: hypothetical protein AUG51_22070 [Acidobacteria bacterium 13_1_20CM_3_53_8]